MDHPSPLRAHLARLLDWEDAHANFDTAAEGIPPDRYGDRPDGLPYSPWELLEHMRLTQHDILDFCINPDYVQPEWPADYWPENPAPPSPEDWVESIVAFRRDRVSLKQLALNKELDLYEQIPHGEGQTYLREILLAADHAAYHVGQLVAVRRLLGIWE